MCGIAGYFGQGNEEMLASMLGIIKHRGPDDSGYYIDGNVGIGNNRLSIIDLSLRGKQPIFNTDKSACIVFNGEIYNFKEVRKKLKGKYKFSSDTDTEVILHAYSEWGINCLQYLNGMFAFVIYDRKKKLLFGARDRLGEKPLKYYIDNNTFAFASEIKGLMPAVKKRELDSEAINDYLTLQYVPAPKTGFKKIFKLPPAHYFIFSNSKLSIRKYWSLDFSKKRSLKEGEWEELLFEKIEQSVESRTISDVPIGAFLSGGVDSSTVVALLAANKKSKIKTFNIGFNDPEFDESKYAQLVASRYGTDHSTLEIGDKEMTDVFIKLPDYYDEPLADNSSIPTIILSRFTSEKVKVALSGDGGDENFGGYERYRVVLFSKIYKNVPKFLRERIINDLIKISSLVFKTKLIDRAAIFSRTYGLPFSERYLYYNSFFTNELKKSLLSKDFLRMTKDKNTLFLFNELHKSDLSDLDNAFNIDINSYLPEDLLYKVDIASMASSLEVRAPLLNHELLELTAQMPDSLKVGYFNQKLIFKKLLEKRKIIPTEILRRPKRGFTAPINRWMRTDLKSYTIDQLTTSKIKELEIFDQQKIENYLNAYFSNQHQDKNNVFALLSLAGWVNKYF